MITKDPQLISGESFAEGKSFAITARTTPRAVPCGHQPGLSPGILAGADGNWRLAQAVGQQAARRVLYAGARLTAAKPSQPASSTHPTTTRPNPSAPSPPRSLASPGGLELTRLAPRAHRPATATSGVAAQALLSTSQDRDDRMTAFPEGRNRKG